LIILQASVDGDFAPYGSSQAKGDNASDTGRDGQWIHRQVNEMKMFIRDGIYGNTKQRQEG
jgi:hypothetical protein